MKRLELINNLVKETLKTNNWFLIFPFAIIAIVLTGVYYVLISLYLLFDLIKLEIKSPLNKENENEPNGVQIVKYIFGFGLVIYFNLITAIFSIVLGIIYFIIVVSLFISSIGKVKTTPFGFHTIQ